MALLCDILHLEGRKISKNKYGGRQPKKFENPCINAFEDIDGNVYKKKLTPPLSSDIPFLVSASLMSNSIQIESTEQNLHSNFFQLKLKRSTFSRRKILDYKIYFPLLISFSSVYCRSSSYLLSYVIQCVSLI